LFAVKKCVLFVDWHVPETEAAREQLWNPGWINALRVDARVADVKKYAACVFERG